MALQAKASAERKVVSRQCAEPGSFKSESTVGKVREMAEMVTMGSPSYAVK